MATKTKGRIRHTVTAGNRIAIPDYNMSGSTATELTGFTINSTEAYCVKQNTAKSKATITRISNVNTTSAYVRGQKVINYCTFGMTYWNKYLYIASKNSTIIKTSAFSSTDTPTLYTVKVNGALAGVEAIAHYKNDQFLVMANNQKAGNYLCFLLGTFSDSTKEFVVSKRFYVNNTSGNTKFKDIHYEPNYGLYIVTNKMSGNAYTTSSIIMHADIDTGTDLTYNGYELYNPACEYLFETRAGRYDKAYVESLAIGNDGLMYLATSLKPNSSSTFKTDGIFYVNNIILKKKNPTTIKFSCNKGVDIEDVTVTVDGIKQKFPNPGALALNGNVGYCLRTHTTHDDYQDKLSVLLSSKNVASVDFTRVTGSPVLKTMGHGNGMTYYDKHLYVAAYDRNTNPKRKEIAKLDLNGNLVETYQCDNIIGGISHYDGEQFIVMNYEANNLGHYTQYPEFFIGHFSGKKFVKDRTFKAENPTYVEKKTVSQDIFYTPEHGLFFVTLTSGVSRIYRVTAEQLESVGSSPVMPKEVYIVKDDTLHEIESMATNSSGLMYIAENYGTDYVKQMLNVKFLKDTFTV